MKAKVFITLLFLMFTDFVFSQFTNSLIPYRKGTKWGYCSRDKKIVVPPKYFDAGRFSEGLAAVKMIDYGYINEKGEEVIPCKYAKAEDFHDGMAIVYAGYQKGYVNKSGKEICMSNHGKIWAFKDGIGLIESEGEIYCIDTSGKKIIPNYPKDHKDRFIEMSLPQEGLIAVKETRWFKECGYINIDGIFAIEPKFRSVGDFSDGMALVNINGQKVFINKKGELVIPLQYRHGYAFHNGLARVEGLINDYNNDNFGFIDKEGNEVIPLKYKQAEDFSEGLAVVLGNEYIEIDGVKTFRNGYIDQKGTLVIKYQFEEARGFKEGLAAVQSPFKKDNQKYGFIDTKGKVIIQFKYEKVEDFSDGISKVKLNGKWGYIDKKGVEFFEE
jgi:hypothetical protein